MINNSQWIFDINDNFLRYRHRSKTHQVHNDRKRRSLTSLCALISRVSQLSKVSKRTTIAYIIRELRKIDLESVRDGGRINRGGQVTRHNEAPDVL